MNDNEEDTHSGKYIPARPSDQAIVVNVTCDGEITRYRTHVVAWEMRGLADDYQNADPVMFLDAVDEDNLLVGVILPDGKVLDPRGELHDSEDAFNAHAQEWTKRVLEGLKSKKQEADLGLKPFYNSRLN